MNLRHSLVALLLAALAALAAPAFAAEPLGAGRGPAIRPLPGRPGPGGGDAKPAEPDWSQADIVFYGKLTKVTAGPIAKSFPPIYSHTLNFTVEETLRGDFEKGEEVTGLHSARQMDAPTFPEGENCLVAASFVRGNYEIKGVRKADADTVKKLAAQLTLPLGWKVGADGKPVSPWPAGSVAEGTSFGRIGDVVTCSVINRPALLAGKAQLLTSPTPPAKAIKWTNPDGDGEYNIVVANPTDEEIQVPALLTDGETVFWKECLVIQCQGNAYPIPGAKPLSGELKPVTLKPGEEISTVVNALSLVGPEWPKGGYRIEFQFCLGQKSTRQSFYYMSRHHDALRDKAQGKR